jgi:hypothetical protein
VTRRLSVSIVTRDSATRLESLIAHARQFAGEVVVGVDASSSDSTWDVAAAFADASWRFEHDGQLGPAHLEGFRHCSGDWILRLDDDELMEDTFADVVQELMATGCCTHYAFPRKWVVSLNPPAYIHEATWYPDYSVRMFVNDVSRIWKPPRYHTGLLVAGQGLQENRCAILHYEPILCSAEQRAIKVRRYRAGGAPPESECAYTGFTGMRRPFVPPRQPRSSRPSATRTDSSVHSLVPVSLPAWGCRFLAVDVPRNIGPRQPLLATLAIENTGQMTWVPYQDAGWPRLTIGTHVKTLNGQMLEFNGPRIPLRAVVPPGGTIEVSGLIPAPATAGEYLLTWDMVSESECWFEQCGHTPVDTPLSVDAG